MSDRRVDSLFFSASPTLATKVPSLLYGAVLTAKSSNASLSIYDHDTLTGAKLTYRKVVLYLGSATSSVTWDPVLPLEMASGVFASAAAGSVVTVLFSKRR